VTVARQLLGAIRLANGSAALLAPRLVARRLGDHDPSPGMLYALRLFGVRTVVLGAELLLDDAKHRAAASRAAVVIHAVDTTAAVVAGRHGGLAPRTARALALLSATNTGLALLVRRSYQGSSA
jgi:hypothetical protein